MFCPVHSFGLFVLNKTEIHGMYMGWGLKLQVRGMKQGQTLLVREMYWGLTLQTVQEMDITSDGI